MVLPLPLPVLAVLTSLYCFSQGQEDDQKESGISCYTCGLETVDPHLDKPGSYSTRVYTHKTKLEFKMYNHSCDEMDRKEGQDIPVTLTSIDLPGVKLATAVKVASGGKYDLVKGFEIYEEEYVLLREKVPELDEWDKSTVIVAKVKENYNMAMWIKECDKGITSCFVAQGDYDNQLPTFRGCAGTVYPHDEKCAFEKQAVSIVEGKKSVDVGVSLCYCNQDLCNIDLSGVHSVWPGRISPLEPTKPIKTTTPTNTGLGVSVILTSMEDSCGKRPTNSLEIAKTGTDVKVPWAASIGKYFENGFDHHCTGSILSPGIVISAAHCISSSYFDRETFKVRAGVQNLKNNFGAESRIRKAVFHSQWREKGKREIYFDVALFFLKDPFPLSPSLQPICLPTKTFTSLPDEMVGAGITTVGWGRDNDDNIGGQITQIDVTIRSNRECNLKYNQTDWRNQLRLKKQLPRQLISSQFCADNNLNTGIGTCHGDSGGPSFVRKFVNGEEKFVILGATSGSISCGGGVPDFYTFLAHEDVLPWIHRAAADDEEKLSEFNHLSDNSWVHCKEDSECSSGDCEEDICLPTLTASAARRLGPSSKCPDEEKPCLDGKECKKPSCNVYGNACFCPQSKKKRSTKEMFEEGVTSEEKTFVSGNPEKWDIECAKDSDCPTDWFCEDQFCYAPLTFPSSAWAALSAPVISRLGTISASAPLGPPDRPCLCKPDCTSPVCNSLNRCWCVARGWRRG